MRRHRLAECFLTDVLGLNWTDAHSEAGRWEHVISPTVETAMLKVLGEPQTCPHGNPIPGSGYKEPTGAVVLSKIDAGDPFTVVRIPEELEWETGQLEFLESTGLMPGRSGVVLSFAPDGTATVDVGDNSIWSWWPNSGPYCRDSQAYDGIRGARGQDFGPRPLLRQRTRTKRCCARS
ncbi:MAG: metal-dependent transcriptional regulator [Candidatus Poriferisodalaceae bacterium]